MTRSDDSTTAESDDEDFDTDRERDTASTMSVPADTDLNAETESKADPVAAEESVEKPVEAEFDSETVDSGPAVERAAPQSEDRQAAAAIDPDEMPVQGRRRPEPAQRTRVPALREWDDELDPDDPDFVPSRRGRGGYDPEADAIARAARYTFRQRAVLGLVLSALIFAGGALAISAAMWTLCALAAIVLVGYLAYLRRQVRLEEDIRRRRMARLSRSDEEQGDAESAPEPESPRPDREAARTQLRRAVLVEPDDEDPVFENLELFDAATARAARERAAGRVRRAVGE